MDHAKTGAAVRGERSVRVGEEPPWIVEAFWGPGLGAARDKDGTIRRL
jgi:hypothetical protein